MPWVSLSLSLSLWDVLWFDWKHICGWHMGCYYYMGCWCCLFVWLPTSQTSELWFKGQFIFDGDKGGTNQHAPFLTQLNYLFDLFVDPPAVYIVMLKFCGRWCNVCWSSPHFHWLNPMVNHLPSSKLTVCYWTWSFIVDLPIKNGDFL